MKPARKKNAKRTKNAAAGEKTFRIIDTTTGQTVFAVDAPTKATAILRFRRRMKTAHNYPHVTAIESTSRTSNGLRRPKAGKLSPRVTAALKKYVKASAKTRTRNGPGTDEILAQFEAFHGRPADGIKDRDETLLVRTRFAKLGKLLDLEVYIDEDRPVLLSPRGVELVASGDGGSLYFKGGDQELDLVGLDLAGDLPKDYITVGTVQNIAYHTSKGFHDFEPRDYTHEFGEEGGTLPTLSYDTTNKLLFLTGGSYQVRPEGIVN